MTDLSVIRGDTHQFTLTLVDNVGDPYDLTSAELVMTVGDLFSKSEGDGITVSDPTGGIAEIVIDGDDTDGAPDHRCAYPYDIQVTLAGGPVKTPVRGLFIVVPDVTT